MRALLRRSLSLRLLVIFVVTGAAVLATLVLLLRGGLAAQWRLAMQPHLQRYVEYALEDLGSPPSLARAPMTTACGASSIPNAAPRMGRRARCGSSRATASG